MLSDKETKNSFREKASKNPEQYYATTVLNTEGFQRYNCSNCKKYFWTTQPSLVCGDAACSGGYRFIGNTPATNPMTYVQVWERFSTMFKSFGYTPIKRYPIIARWREDTDFVQASIYDFQPYVVSGEVAPPANPLIVPQFCVRFNDIDNVGITGAHYTGFVMIGQHAFMQPKDWNQTKYFQDIYNWCTKGLGIPKKELVFHEEAWAGGGNYGPCMEFFSRGLELGNQVYMLYEQTPTGGKELPIKVLDMGMGHERNAWFSSGASTSYETTFPEVLKRMRHETGVAENTQVMSKFLPHAGLLNSDEVTNMQDAWNTVAKKTGIHVNELRAIVEPLSSLYSVAEHARSLLVALSDGGLPSNVGGMYNLRVIFRRAQHFIESHKWKLTIPQICEWHADELKPLFPELRERAIDVAKILHVEKTKYATGLQKTTELLKKIANETITTERLLELYDSHGIPPDALAIEAAKVGRTIDIPDNFYALVSARHAHQEQETQTTRTTKLPLEGIHETTPLYFEDYTLLSFEAKILRIIGNNVILNKSAFYPTSGGQLHDTGTLNGVQVNDVFKQGNIIVHVLEGNLAFKEGDTVHGIINKERRTQLSIHHTATHIINAAAHRILGNHANQASAKKDVDKAYIDITHYEVLTPEELARIEKEANAIVEEHINTDLSFMTRTDAEKSFGIRIYQGGAVPGKLLRIVQIPEVDVQACGGTHLHNTQEVGRIKILKTTKVKDGVIRIFFAAGNAAEQLEQLENGRIQELATLLHVPPNQVPARAKELLEKWKLARKSATKGQTIDQQTFILTSNTESTGDILAETSTILGTQVEYLAKSILRFLEELEEYKKQIKNV